MYRIIFNTHNCVWVIQLVKFGFVWTTLKGQEFADYDTAVGYVKTVGLDKVYRDYAGSNLHHFLDGAR